MCRWLLLHLVTHTVTHIHTHTHIYIYIHKHGRTPMDEGSASRKGLYLTTHNTHYRQPCPRQDSKPQSQPVSGRRPTPYSARPLGSTCHVPTIKNLADDDDDDKQAVHTLFTTTNKKYWLE